MLPDTLTRSHTDLFLLNIISVMHNIVLLCNKDLFRLTCCHMTYIFQQDQTSSWIFVQPKLQTRRNLNSCKFSVKDDLCQVNERTTCFFTVHAQCLIANKPNQTTDTYRPSYLTKRVRYRPNAQWH